jgi:methyl-accepting chemotaxis protein
MAMRIGARLTATFGVVLALLLVICVTVSAQMSHMNANLQGPLQRVVAGANALAQGNLSVNIEVLRQDEVGAVAQSQNQAISQLAVTVRGVKEASELISSATQQLAAGNFDLSQRTEEQASSLEKTASSMDELTATVRLVRFGCS